MNSIQRILVKSVYQETKMVCLNKLLCTVTDEILKVTCWEALLPVVQRVEVTVEVYLVRAAMYNDCHKSFFYIKEHLNVHTTNITAVPLTAGKATKSGSSHNESWNMYYDSFTIDEL